LPIELFQAMFSKGGPVCPSIWVFPKIVEFPPKWMVKIMENPIKHGMIWGGKPTIYGNTHIYPFKILPLTAIYP